MRLGPGNHMVRSIVFAVAGLVGVGAMVTIEARTPPRPVVPAGVPLAPATIGFDGSHDTLTKADRLDLSYVGTGVPLQPILPAQFVSPAEPVLLSSPPGSQGTNRQDSNSRKLAVVLPRSRPRNPIKDVPQNLAKHMAKNETKNETKHAAQNGAKSVTKVATNSPANSSANAGKKVANTDRSKLVAEPCKPNPFGSLLKALNLSSGCQT
jgi:hypothetical protein